MHKPFSASLPLALALLSCARATPSSSPDAGSSAVQIYRSRSEDGGVGPVSEMEATELHDVAKIEEERRAQWAVDPRNVRHQPLPPMVGNPWFRPLRGGVWIDFIVQHRCYHQPVLSTRFEKSRVDLRASWSPSGPESCPDDATRFDVHLTGMKPGEYEVLFPTDPDEPPCTPSNLPGSTFCPPPQVRSFTVRATAP